MTARLDTEEQLLSLKYAAGDFEIGKVLGRGAFASAYFGRRKADGKRVVIKKCEQFSSTQQKKAARNELLAMAVAGSHQSIVSFLGWYEEDDAPCIVLGYCQGGTLYQLLRGPDSGAAPGSEGPEVLFTENQIMSWFIQLLLGLDHLHLQRIMHRDIKPQNIFLSRTKQFVKLGDLGVSAVLDSTGDLRSTVTGSPLYMGPELMSGLSYSLSSDIWSLGCVLYEMAARRTAFDAVGLPQLVAKVVNNLWQPLPSVYSSPFRQLVASMLRPDPSERPSTRRLLSSPYVKKHLELFAKKYPNRVPQSQIPDVTLPANFEAKGKAAVTSRRGPTDESTEIKMLERGRLPSSVHPSSSASFSRPTTSSANHARNWGLLGSQAPNTNPPTHNVLPPTATKDSHVRDSSAGRERVKSAWGSPSRGPRGDSNPPTASTSGRGPSPLSSRRASVSSGTPQRRQQPTTSTNFNATNPVQSSRPASAAQAPATGRPASSAASRPQAATVKASSTNPKKTAKDLSEVAPSRRVRPRANVGATNLGATKDKSGEVQLSNSPRRAGGKSEEEPRVGGGTGLHSARTGPPPSTPAVHASGSAVQGGSGSRAGSKQRGSAIQTMTLHAKPRVWEPAVGYVQEQKELAQRRFQALQLSMRKNREQVRQKKKGNDPAAGLKGDATSAFPGRPPVPSHDAQGLIRRFHNHDLVPEGLPLHALPRGPLDPIESVSWAPSNSTSNDRTSSQTGDQTVQSGSAGKRGILEYISPSSTFSGSLQGSINLPVSQTPAAAPLVPPEPSQSQPEAASLGEDGMGHTVLAPLSPVPPYVSPRYDGRRSSSYTGEEVEEEGNGEGIYYAVQGEEEEEEDDDEYAGLPPIIHQDSAVAFYRGRGEGGNDEDDEDYYYEDDDFEEEEEGEDGDEGLSTPPRTSSNGGRPSFTSTFDEPPEVLLLSLSSLEASRKAAVPRPSPSVSSSGKASPLPDVIHDESRGSSAPSSRRESDKGNGSHGKPPRPPPVPGASARASGGAMPSAQATALLSELQKVWDSDPSVRFALLRELWNMSLVDSLGTNAELAAALTAQAASLPSTVHPREEDDRHSEADSVSTQEMPTLSEFVVPPLVGSSPSTRPQRPPSSLPPADEASAAGPSWAETVREAPLDSKAEGNGPESLETSGGFEFLNQDSVLSAGTSLSNSLEPDPVSRSALPPAPLGGPLIPFGSALGTFSIPPPSTDLAVCPDTRPPSGAGSRRVSSTGTVSSSHEYEKEQADPESLLLPGAALSPSPLFPSLSVPALTDIRDAQRQSRPSLPSPNPLANDQGYLALLRDLKALKRANTENGLFPTSSLSPRVLLSGRTSENGQSQGPPVPRSPRTSTSSVRSSWGAVVDPRASFKVAARDPDEGSESESDSEGEYYVSEQGVANG